MSDKKLEAFVSCVVVIMAVPFLMVYGYFANGFVLSRLWEWFIVSVFDWPSLNIVQAIGVSIVVSFLTHQNIEQPKNKEQTTTDIVVKILVALGTPWLTMLVGWIVYSNWIMK
jgi:putative Mn2+ efflux pump MntP